jgi:hypothetical protein
MAICIIFKHKIYPSQNSFWKHNSTLTNPVTYLNALCGSHKYAKTNLF